MGPGIQLEDVCNACVNTAAVWYDVPPQFILGSSISKINGVAVFTIPNANHSRPVVEVGPLCPSAGRESTAANHHPTINGNVLTVLPCVFPNSIKLKCSRPFHPSWSKRCAFVDCGRQLPFVVSDGGHGSVAAAFVERVKEKRPLLHQRCLKRLYASLTIIIIYCIVP